MERKLVDALEVQLESGAIMTTQNSRLEKRTCFSLAPDRDDIMNLRTDVQYGLFEFQRLAAYFRLPTHNAVAFFTKALEREGNLNAEQREQFGKLLHLAISGRGFCFGTAFNMEHSSDLRTCDMKPAPFFWQRIERLENLAEARVLLAQIHDSSQDSGLKAELDCYSIYLATLENHAALMGAAYFREDYAVCETILKGLQEQNQLVLQWQDKVQGVAQDPCYFEPTARAVFQFWTVYKKYCLSQLSLSETKGGKEQKLAMATETAGDQVKRDLENAEKSIYLLVHLDCFCRNFEELMKCADDTEHLARKERLISRFLRFLRRPRTLDAFEAADETAKSRGEAMKPFLGLKDLVYIMDYMNIPKHTIQAYPFLDCSVVQRSLLRSEGKALKGYREHPMYQCFRGIKRAFSNAVMTCIAPYCLLTWFVQKFNVLNPFKRSKYKFDVEDIKIDSEIKVSNDKRVHHFQKCNFHFYEDLCAWYSNMNLRGMTAVPLDERLCNALYVRCRHQVVQNDWLLAESRPLYKRWTAEERIYQLYQQLDGIFDCGKFPIYAKTMCRDEEMLYFFYEKQDRQICSVKRQIRKMIDSDPNIVETYRELALLSHDGIGKSAMPIEWHWELAEFLDGIIRRNKTVMEYCEGDLDPYYPGSAMRLSILNSGIDYAEKKYRICPEDLQPYLSVVEWYIQRVCLEKIAETLRPNILGMCKRIFLQV